MPITKIRVKARQGPDLSPKQILPALRKALTEELGPWTPKHLDMAGKLRTTVNVGKPKRGKQVARILDDLDFTVADRPTLGIVAGVRLEIDRTVTYVHYSILGGVVTITTNAADDLNL